MLAINIQAMDLINQSKNPVTDSVLGAEASGPEKVATITVVNPMTRIAITAVGTLIPNCCTVSFAARRKRFMVRLQ